MRIKDRLKAVVRDMPELPGVYRYFDKDEVVIYVGKAKNLKKRVGSYFTKSHQGDAKTRRLVHAIREIRFTVTDSEADALLLENNLIKTHQPHYNILLKDGKSYPYICITNEPFPQIYPTRNVKNKKNTYYGPYTNKRVLNAMLELIKKVYAIRSCQLPLTPSNVHEGKFRLCLEYHIGNCKGPCTAEQSIEEYNADIEQIRHILKGKLTPAKAFLKQKMEDAAEKMAFEQAFSYKKKLDALDNFQSKSLVVNPNISDLEVYTVAADEQYAYLNYLMIEDGCIIRAQNEAVKKKLDESEEEILLHMILEFRQRFGSEASKILTNVNLSIPIPNVEINLPKIGDLSKLVSLSLKNVHYFQREEVRKREERKKAKQYDGQKVLRQLQQDLSLKELPVHIECFDNSNLFGTNPVSAMVCFKDGKPSKRNYRKFNIKTVEGIDDFASMYEVVYRRYKRLTENKLPLPQLVIVDGGKGQLSSACRALKDLGVYGKLPIVGIAKRLEEIYYPEDQIPVHINRKSPSLRLIQQLRDEAHRFAITFHRDKRSLSSITSSLESIKGIGKETAEKLLVHFKSLRKIKEADPGELEELIGTHRAKLVLEAREKGLV